MTDLMLRVENVSKRYRLGQIGGTTLRDELQRLAARVRGREDPTRRIGSREVGRGETFLALDGVSFDVQKGERVGIIGRNGAGKSTLLKLISRVTTPTSGRIGLNGRVASMLEVGTGFHWELTGRENIYMNGAILGMTKREIDRKIGDIIAFSEVGQFVDTPVKRYSSGMYVKLAFSVAAHLDSEILIMDEVLAVGDMAFQKKCLDKMNEVSKNERRTILFVSHNMTTIRQLCDRVILLEKGKVAFDGEVEEGIGRYLGTGNAKGFPVEYDFSEIPRSYQFGSEIFAEGFRFLQNPSAEYVFGGSIPFEIVLRSKISREGICCVVCVRDAGNSQKLAASVSEPFSVREGERKAVCFAFPTRGLLPDTYSLSFELVQFDASGNYYSYENPLVPLPVCLREDETAPVRWSRQFWGNVELSETVLVSERELGIRD